MIRELSTYLEALYILKYKKRFTGKDVLSAHLILIVTKTSFGKQLCDMANPPDQLPVQDPKRPSHPWELLACSQSTFGAACQFSWQKLDQPFCRLIQFLIRPVVNPSRIGCNNYGAQTRAKPSFTHLMLNYDSFFPTFFAKKKVFPKTG